MNSYYSLIDDVLNTETFSETESLQSKGYRAADFTTDVTNAQAPNALSVQRYNCSTVNTGKQMSVFTSDCSSIEAPHKSTVRSDFDSSFNLSFFSGDFGAVRSTVNSSQKATHHSSKKVN